MLGSGSFFRFSFQYPEHGVGNWTYAVAYKPPGPMRAGALQQLILDVCRGPVVPDAVVLVGLKEDSKGELLETLMSDQLATARQRIVGRIALLSVTIALKTERADLKILDDSFKGKRSDFLTALKAGSSSWLKAGLHAAFPGDEVLLWAPAGYAYQKPSGSRSTVFLKPDLSLKSSASVAYVALVIFLRLYSGNVTRLRDLETVFVDTMAIAPVAYALRDLMALCGHARPFVIESFHSYGGFDEVVRPLAGTSLCLISASASMNLHKRWVQEKQVLPFEVVTLLTLEAAGNLSEGALLALPIPAEHNTDERDAQFSIRIAGETFMPEHEPAKKVLLREVQHRCDDDVKWLRAFAGKGVFDVYRRAAAPTSKPRALFVDGDKLREQVEFSSWLKDHVRRRVKASTKVIIYQDDLASRSLATQVQTFAASDLGLNGLQLVAQSQLAATALPTDAAVIVCAAVVGKGSLLLEISRTLRDKDCGARLYFIGFQVTDSRAELTALKLNLQHDKLVSHDFAAFGAIAVGRQVVSAFTEEIRRCQVVGADASAYPGSLGTRLAALGAVGPVGPQGLLPHGNDACLPLRLRDTFAFWRPGYVPGPHHAEVLATIAVILQRAREDRKMDEADQLATSTYRHVALHPDNFSRFNDGIVQAALLRCAYPSELDYRDDYAASDFLKGLVLRALNRASDEAGEGILEFILALVSKRMQLVDEHLLEVLTAAESLGHLGPELRQAIKFLINPSTGLGKGVGDSPI